MEDLHATFVLASYGLAALIMGGLIAWLWYDAGATKRELKRLEEQGLRRRSDGV